MSEHFGYLDKQSPAGFQLWQKRFFVFQNDSLSYYASHKDSSGTPKGCIQLIYISDIKLDNKVFLVTVVGGNVFRLRGDTKEVAMRWVKLLETKSSELKENALGNGRVAAPMGGEKFWKMGINRSSSFHARDSSPQKREKRSITAHGPLNTHSEEKLKARDVARKAYSTYAYSDVLSTALESLTKFVDLLGTEIDLICLRTPPEPHLKFVYGEEFNNRVFDSLASLVSEQFAEWTPSDLLAFAEWIIGYEARLSAMGLTSLETKMPRMPQFLLDGDLSELSVVGLAILSESLVSYFMDEVAPVSWRASSDKGRRRIGYAKQVTRESDADNFPPLPTPELPPSPSLRTLIQFKNTMLTNESQEELVTWLSIILTVMRLHSPFPVRELEDCGRFTLVWSHLRDCPRSWLDETLLGVLCALVCDCPGLDEKLFSDAMMNFFLDFDLWTCVSYDLQTTVMQHIHQIAELNPQMMKGPLGAHRLMSVSRRYFRTTQTSAMGDLQRFYHSITSEELGCQVPLSAAEAAELRATMRECVTVVAHHSLTAEDAQHIISSIDSCEQPADAVEVISFVGNFLQTEASSPGATVLSAHFTTPKSLCLLFKLLRNTDEMTRTLGAKLVIEVVRASGFKGSENERRGLYSALGVVLQAFPLADEQGDFQSMTYHALLECLLRKVPARQKSLAITTQAPVACAIDYSGTQQELTLTPRSRIVDAEVLRLLLALLPALDSRWAEHVLGDLNVLLMKSWENVELWNSMFGWQMLLLRTLDQPRSWTEPDSKCVKLISNLFKLVVVHSITNTSDHCSFLWQCLVYLDLHESRSKIKNVDATSFGRRLILEVIFSISRLTLAELSSGQATNLWGNLSYLLMYLEEVVFLSVPSTATTPTSPSKSDGCDSPTWTPRRPFDVVNSRPLRRHENGEWLDLPTALMAVKLLQSWDVVSDAEFKQYDKDKRKQLLRKGGYVRLAVRLLLTAIAETRDASECQALCQQTAQVLQEAWVKTPKVRQENMMAIAWMLTQLTSVANTAAVDTLLHKVLASVEAIAEPMAKVAATDTTEFLAELRALPAWSATVLPLLNAAGTTFLQAQATADAEFLSTLQSLRAADRKTLTEDITALEKAVAASVHTVQAALTIIVGRAAELQRFQKMIDKLQTQKQGALVMLEGAAGVGKSLLVTEMGFLANMASVPVIVDGGSKFDSAIPYRWWTAIIARCLELDRNTESGPDAVHTFLERSLPQWVGLEALLAPLLPFELADNAVTAEITGESRRATLTKFLFELVRSFLEHSPKVLVLEGVHWMDGQSWSLLEMVVKNLPHAAIVLTCRSTDRLPESYTHLTEMTSILHMKLENLNAADIKTLVKHKLGGAVSQELADYVFEKSDGHPFVCESVAMALRDMNFIEVVDSTWTLSTRADIDWSRIPNNIDELIHCRLDCLTPMQIELLSIAAIIGHTFCITELYHMAGSRFSTEAIDQALQECLQADLLLLVDDDGPTYAFKQVIVQTNAYNLMPESRRMWMHECAAVWVETHMDVSQHFSDLARHWTHAQQLAKAVFYLERAGEVAASVHSHADTISFIKKALDLAETMPADEVSSLRKGRWLRFLGEAYHGLGHIGDARSFLEEAVTCLRGKPLDPAVMGKKHSFGDRKSSLSPSDRTAVMAAAAAALASSGSSSPPSRGSASGSFSSPMPSPRLSTSGPLSRKKECSMPPESEMELCNVLDTLFQVLFMSGQKESRYVAVTALSHADNLGPSTQLAKALATASVAARVNNEPALADEYELEALYVASRLSTARDITLCYVHMMTSISRLSAHQMGGLADNLARCVATYTQLGNSRKVGESMFIRQLVLFFESQLEAASELAWELAELGSSLDDAQLSAWGLTSRARVMVLTSSDNDAILDTLLKADFLLGKHKNLDLAEQINVFGLRALVSFRQGRHVQARTLADQMVSLAPKVPANLRLAIAYVSVAEMAALGWESAAQARNQDELTAYQAVAKQVRRLLADVAKTFDVTRARCMIWESFFLGLEGKVKAAEKIWDEMGELAASKNMKLEEGLCCYCQGNFSAALNTRAAALNKARRAFADIGADYYLSLMGMD